LSVVCVPNAFGTKQLFTVCVASLKIHLDGEDQMALCTEYIPPPNRIEIGTVSLTTSSRCVRAGRCTSTAAYVNSSTVLREAQQMHCGRTYNRIVSVVCSTLCPKFN